VVLTRSAPGPQEPQNSSSDDGKPSPPSVSSSSTSPGKSSDSEQQQQQPSSSNSPSPSPPRASQAPPSSPETSQQQQQQQQPSTSTTSSSSSGDEQKRSRRASRASRERKKQEEQQQQSTVNPYTLGRQARKAFDEVWSQVSNLAAPTKSSAYLDDDALGLEPSRAVEFEAPQAAYTTVLVVGATGRVGRILVRKLLLRGYKVKALVRRRQGKERDELQAIPSAVEIVEGDLGDMDCCQDAVKNVNKVRRGNDRDALRGKLPFIFLQVPFFYRSLAHFCFNSVPLQSKCS
jgi:hypothetical protein